MAKPLTKPQPRSSVSNMLDLSVGAAALSAPPQPAESQEISTPVQAVALPPAPAEEEVASIHRQFILTRSADETLKKVLQIYSKATGLDLKASELLRALLLALEHVAPELEREAARIGRLKRPKNERSNKALRDELERNIARAIVSGARAANLME